jgi:alanyl-tRNA synthetase
MSASVRLLSVLPAELPGGIERLQADARAQKRTIAGLQAELASYRAEELARNAEEITLTAGSADLSSRCRLVARALDTDANGLKSLASAIAAKPGLLVALVSASTPALIVIARSSDIDVSAQQLLAKLVAQFGGRGGGRSEMSQGGGLSGTAEAIFQALRAQL